MRCFVVADAPVSPRSPGPPPPPPSQVERLHQELALSRDELGRRVHMAADTADAMLHNAAGEYGGGGGRVCYKLMAALSTWPDV